MNFALGYLVHRFFFRLTDFFHHWYIDGSKVLFHWLVSSLERMDRFFAVGINLRYFFHPLYRDYSIIGRFLGIIFRSIRIILGIVIYSFMLSIFFIFYFFWLSIPAAILFYALKLTYGT